MQTKSTISFLSSWFIGLLFGLFITWKKADSAVVLQYHHISNTTPEITSLSPELFAKHLQYLNQNQFKVLSLEQFIRYLEQGKGFPEKSVLITFDDGYRSIYDIAFPLLKKYKYPFTVFVNTDPLEQKLEQFMTWEELQSIIDYGGAIANHSVSHPHMIPQNQKDMHNPKSEKNIIEVRNAEKLLSSNLSKFHRVFAYPYGEYDNQVKNVLKNLDYIAFGQHSGAVGISSDKLALPRFPFGGRFGKLEDFILKVNSQALEVEESLLLGENNELLDTQLIASRIGRLKLLLKLPDNQKQLNISCFASDGSQLETEKRTNGYLFSMKNELRAGRSRINCTAPSAIKDSFYWFSQPLIKANSNGDFF